MRKLLGKLGGNSKAVPLRSHAYQESHSDRVTRLNRPFACLIMQSGYC